MIKFFSLLPLYFTFITLIAAYPIKELLNQIEAGNTKYVEKYLSDLSNREFLQPDMQFLNSLLNIETEPLNQIIKQINVEDLSGHLAPIYHIKKAEFLIHNDNFREAINNLKIVLHQYRTSNYIKQTYSLLMYSYKNSGHLDSIKYYEKWIEKNYKNITDIKPISSALPQKTDKLIDNTKNLNTRYTIQAGAFGHKINAEKLVKKLNNSGFNARIDIIKKKNGNLYAVRVGNIEKHNEAIKLRSKLRNKMKMTFYIKEIDN